jgi:ATP-grasp domain, R2K clade family 2
MNILFCDDAFDNKTVDLDYEDEFLAAKENSFVTHLFSFESLTKDNDALTATRRIKSSETLQKIIYRGWMLKPKHYALLFDTLLSKNYQLINSPIEYQNCHYLPDSYKFIIGQTPKSIWFRIENQEVNFENLYIQLKAFGSSPLIVKDYVKSQKHYWDTACFIPSASENEKVKSIVSKFVELQNTDLNEGLVFREFIELNDLTIHSKSGMPLKQEYRLFFLNKELLGSFDYWEEGEYSTEETPPLEFFKEIATKIESNFFSMDIAKTKNGDWTIIELGDGQVAGLPDKVNRNEFYGMTQKFYGR